MAITSGTVTGLTTYCAPARSANRAVSASSTVPTPMHTSAPASFAEAVSMHWSAPGVVMVTSMQRTPPSMTASTTRTRSAPPPSARTIATMPWSQR